MSPNAQRLFDEGGLAYEAGKSFLDNPYLDTNLTNARIWIDGYVAALIAQRESKGTRP